MAPENPLIPDPDFFHIPYGAPIDLWSPLVSYSNNFWGDCYGEDSDGSRGLPGHPLILPI